VFFIDIDQNESGDYKNELIFRQKDYDDAENLAVLVNKTKTVMKID